LPPLDDPGTDRGTPNSGGESTNSGKVAPETARPRKRGQASGKRWAMLNAFVDAGGTALRSNDWRVWLVLFRDARGDTACTSQNHIAKRLNLDRKTIGRAVKRLESAGLLAVLYRGGFRRGPSIYRLHSMPIHNVPPERH
jgi:biotin operon repressor